MTNDLVLCKLKLDERNVAPVTIDMRQVDFFWGLNLQPLESSFPKDDVQTRLIPK